jgi:hypothetical protein
MLQPQVKFDVKRNIFQKKELFIVQVYVPSLMRRFCLINNQIHKH